MMKLGLAIVALLISAQSIAAETGTPLSQDQIALLDSVMRNCGSRETSYRSDQIAGLTGANQLSNATFGEGDGSGTYIHYYSPQMWDAISAAATQMKALGWVVTGNFYDDSRLNGRVMTSAQYEEILASKEKAKCIIQTEVPMCDDSERRIARELFGFENLTPCGDEKPWDREHPNALRSQHVRMIQSLLDNGYAYSEATKSFEKTEGGGQTGQGAGEALR